MIEGLQGRRARQRSRRIPLQGAPSFGRVGAPRALRRRRPPRGAPPRHLVGPV